MAGAAGPRRGAGLSHLGLVEDGALLTAGGRIVATGRTAELERLPEARRARVVEARGRVVMPAFLDSHTHLVFAAPRLRDYELRIAGATYAQMAGRKAAKKPGTNAGPTGIASSVAAVRAATSEDLLARALFFIRQALACGTATLEIKSGYGLDAENEIKILEVIRDAAARTPAELVPTFLGAHVLPADYRSRRGDYLRLLTRQLIPRVARPEKSLAEFCDVFCDRGAFTLAEAAAILRAAAGHKLKLKIHAEQFTHTGAAALAARLGAASADHLDRVTAADIAALARSSTVATLLPGACFHLGLQYPPARRLIDGGAAVALASDFNPGTSPTLSMQMVLSLACAQMRMTPAEAIVAATLNAAYALGRGGRLGSLEPGKQADLVIMDAQDYREIPYYFGVNHCWMTIKKGKVVWAREPGSFNIESLNP